MTTIQTESLKTAQRLANELRLTVARLLALPVPMADDAAIAMRGAEMAMEALQRLSPIGRVCEVHENGTVEVEFLSPQESEMLTGMDVVKIGEVKIADIHAEQARLRQQLLDETSEETMARLAESRKDYIASNP